MWESTFAQGYSQKKGGGWVVGGEEGTGAGAGEGQTLLLVCRQRPHI